jgi:hypothetical protein
VWVDQGSSEYQPGDGLDAKYRAEAFVYQQLSVLDEFTNVTWHNVTSDLGTRVVELGGIRYSIAESRLPYDIVATKEDGSQHYFQVLSTASPILGEKKAWHMSREIWRMMMDSPRANETIKKNLVFVFESLGNPRGFCFQLDRFLDQTEE